MTARELFEYALIEVSKVHAPSMLLSEFNYFINKAFNLYINKRYNIYDINLQTTDDLRVLKATAILTPKDITAPEGIIVPEEEKLKPVPKPWTTGKAHLYGGMKEVYLPLDYLHILNCICVFSLKSNYKCYNEGDYVQFPAIRLTADAWSSVINDYYNRPLPERPYYYIHNLNTSSTNPTNPINSLTLSSDTRGTDINPFVETYYIMENKVIKEYEWKDIYTEINAPEWVTVEEFESKWAHHPRIASSGNTAYVNKTYTAILPKTIELGSGVQNNSLILKEAGVRYGNPTNVRMEIRYGRDSSVFELVAVQIDYLKTPQYIRLTQELVDLTLDTSLVLEFPDYVCQEIVNELVMLLMENTSDTRLLTHVPVSLSIANPAQQLAPPQPLQGG